MKIANGVEFVNDDRVIGKLRTSAGQRALSLSTTALMGEWDSVAFVSEIGDFSPDKTRFGQLYGEGKSKNITDRDFMRRMVSVNLFERTQFVPRSA